MSERLEFFFDYVSPYTYLADSQIDTLKVDVDYRPVAIVDVMKRVNNQPSPLCPPKGRYIGLDSARWAGIYGVPMAANDALWAAVFDRSFDTSTLIRGAIAAQELGLWSAYHRPMFNAVWAEAGAVHTPTGRETFARVNGLPADFWTTADSETVRTKLEDNCAEAATRGVFGSPTFFLNNEMFFGNDRLDFLRHRLGIGERGLA